MVAFAGVAIAVSVVPGPDMALVARNTLLGGRAVGVATVGGIAGGILAWSALAVAGISALLAASAELFLVVKLCGAAYLVYLGISTLRAGQSKDPALHGRAPMTLRAAGVQGFVSAALNPKLGVLFVTLLPQFTGPAAPPLRSLELAVVFASIGITWLLIYTCLISAVSRLLSRPGPQRAMRWASGGVLVGLGARVAVERG